MPTAKPNILFLTNSEHGQSTPLLAVVEEFIRRDEFCVHIASYGPLAPRVQGLNQRHDCTQPATFHAIAGPSLIDILTRGNVDLCHRPGLTGAIDGFRKANDSLLGLKPREYLQAYQSCLDIINKVHPILAVVDPMLHLASDACRTSLIPTVFLWPVLMKDVVITVQPRAAMFWKYPLTGSGYPFPLPWSLVLANIYLVVRFAVTIGLGKPLRDLKRARKEAGIPYPFPLEQPFRTDSLHLTPAFREMDFPLYVPENVVSCGPILPSAKPLSTSDPTLALWLQKPTIVINLGSHFQPTEHTATQMARGVQSILNGNANIQFLWKLRSDWECWMDFQDIMAPLIAADSVKLVHWISSDIISILEDGHVLAYVHHGGANSFFEACKAGVPQVVLPQWLDTYDCPTRVEWLGIGLHGSKNTAPDIDAADFSYAIQRVMQNEGIRSRAKSMRDVCGVTEGRVVAHDEIVQLARKHIQ